MIIRDVRISDVPQIVSIYSPYVAHSAVSFELEVPSEKMMEERIRSYIQKYPWLVAEEDGKILGYAYASAYRERQAYQWSCESSVYLADSAKKQGVAKKLYDSLFGLLQKQGFRNVYAVITRPNPDSEKFHDAYGFTFLCIFKNVGYKFDKWHDVLWMEKSLNYNGVPTEPAWYKLSF